MSGTNKAVDLADKLRNKNKASGEPDELKIDPHFHEDPSAAMLLEYAIKRGKNAIIIGPTGCGKSSLAINVLARLKRKTEIVSCHGETSSDHLIGKPWLIKDLETQESITKVVYGAALRAYGGDSRAPDGKTLLLEEVDVAISDVLASMQRILETKTEFYHCDIGESEVIVKKPLFSVIATANTIGTGEDSFKYAGTKPLNLAFINRFCPRIIMGYLPKDKEIEVIVNKTGIDKNVASQMVEVADLVRQAGDPKVIAGGLVPSIIGMPLVGVISTRDLIEWGDLVVELNFDVKEAAKPCFLNTMPEAEQEAVQKALDDVIA